MPAKLALPAWAAITFVLVGLAPAQSVRQVRPFRAYDFEAENHDTPMVVTAVAVSPNGQQVAASGDDHAVRLWTLASGEEPALLRGHDDWVRALTFDDANRLATVGDDRRLNVWDLATNQPAIVNQEAAGPIGSVAFMPGGQQLVTAAYGDQIRLLNLSSGMIDKRFKCPCRDARVMAVSPDGKWLAAAGRNGTLRVWDLTTGEQGHDIPADTQRVHAIAFSPDSQQVATGGNGPRIRLWDLATGDLASELPSRPAKVRSLLFLDDNRLASGGTDNRIHIWDLKQGLPTHRLVGHTGTVAVMARDAAGELLVSGGFDTTVMLWRLPQATAAAATANAGAEVLR